MEFYETIIVGAGPAGSSCAWELSRHQREVLILDKQEFPRLKLCAGWIPKKVLDDLELSPAEYPYSMIKLIPKVYFSPFTFPLMGPWTMPWRTDYSIRRIEFDFWLLQRSQAPFKIHQVKKIARQGDDYIIDGAYRCRYLIGAGGTGCPVKRAFFHQLRHPALQISTLEKEFRYPPRGDNAHLFFLFHGLRGYAWYVPKGDGYLNIGLAGTSQSFKTSEISLKTHFQWFLKDLVKAELLDQKTAENLVAAGHGYFLFSQQQACKKNNCFVIGDAAGLASLDLGEGIGPAIESGLLAAREILGQATYERSRITKFSLNPAFRWLQGIWAYN
jgi:flavin-dependent dehydrogenase